MKKCNGCGFIDNPPKGCYELDKCPYCGGDDWGEIKKSKKRKKK